jgi:hypothetical protein
MIDMAARVERAEGRTPVARALRAAAVVAGGLFLVVLAAQRADAAEVSDLTVELPPAPLVGRPLEPVVEPVTSRAPGATARTAPPTWDPALPVELPTLRVTAPVPPAVGPVAAVPKAVVADAVEPVAVPTASDPSPAATTAAGPDGAGRTASVAVVVAPGPAVDGGSAATSPDATDGSATDRREVPVGLARVTSGPIAAPGTLLLLLGVLGTVPAALVVAGGRVAVGAALAPTGPSFRPLAFPG